MPHNDRVSSAENVRQLLLDLQAALETEETKKLHGDIVSLKTDENKQQQQQQQKRERKIELATRAQTHVGQDVVTVTFYNCIDNANTLQEGCETALKRLIDSHESLFNFNGLMAGFLFIGITIGEKPESALQIATSFCVIMGFGASIVATLLLFVLNWYLRMCLEEDPKDYFGDVTTKWKHIPLICYILTIGQVTMLTIGVNIVVHDLYSDLGPINCFASIGQDGPKCNANGAYFWMAVFGNILSLGFFVVVLHFWFNTVFKIDRRRKVYREEELTKLLASDGKDSGRIEEK